jgi:hypothetical protein
MTEKLITPSQLAKLAPAAAPDRTLPLQRGEVLEPLTVERVARGWEFTIGNPATYRFVVASWRMEEIARAALGIKPDPLPDLSPQAEAALAADRARSGGAQ